MHLASPLRRFGLSWTQDIFEIYVDVLDQVRYTDTGNKGLFKMCDVPGKPPTSYLCGANVFTCAITGDEDKEGKDKPDPRAWAAWAHFSNLGWVGLYPGMVAFPQSCVAESWGAANKVGAGTVPNGKASLALYALQTAQSPGEQSTKAYSNYETKGSVKGSRRIIAYQVRFEDVDDAYDGMCQGTLEARNTFLTSNLMAVGAGGNCLRRPRGRGAYKGGCSGPIGAAGGSARHLANTAFPPHT